MISVSKISLISSKMCTLCGSPGPGLKNTVLVNETNETLCSWVSLLQLWMAEDCWIQARLYLGLQQDYDQQDGEPFCFSILVGHGQSYTFRAELANDLAVWENSFQRAVFTEVQRVGVSRGTNRAFLSLLLD